LYIWASEARVTRRNWRGRSGIERLVMIESAVTDG
jgi:hypothetical protein